eukprot:m.197276 g.197276  ORF g.197276 m.197276 type:complete len:231 (-) comp15710_c1_seq7:3122-3814(-)
MTVSFHKYGQQFFPGTGDMDEIGIGPGKYTSVNVPLKDGIDDEGYLTLFKPVMQKIIEVYQPSVIVLQCGADSLGCDRLGCFNLSIQCHGQAVDFIKSFRIPLMVLGGGGYTIRNVARCWTHETGILVGEDLAPELPYNEYFQYFRPDFQLHPNTKTKVVNMNTPSYLMAIREHVEENLRRLKGAPVVDMQEIPASIVAPVVDEDADADVRFPIREQDKHRETIKDIYTD